LESHVQDKLDAFQDLAIANMLPRKQVVLQMVHAWVFLQGPVKEVHRNEKSDGIDVVEV
jgi:hypothetical protein